MKKITAGLCLLALAGQAAAYQIEGAAHIQQLDNQDTYGLGGTFYLDNVNLNSGPFAEAAFLEKTSFVGASYQDMEDISNVDLGGRYIMPDTGFFVDGNLYLGDADGFKLGGGLYITSNSTAGIYLLNSDELDIFGAEYKHLVFRNDGTYLNLEASVARNSYDTEFSYDQDFTEVAVGGDYYFNKLMSLGADLSVYFGDNDGEELTISGQHFLTHQLAVSAGVIFADRETQDSDVGFQFGAIARF